MTLPSQARSLPTKKSLSNSAIVQGRPRIAVVTGTSSGIGLAIARKLLADRWVVRGLDRAPAVLMAENFAGQTVDLTQGVALEAALDSALNAELSGVAPDALVHAAGMLRVGQLGSLDPASGEAMWRLHVDAATRLANRLLPAMQAAGGGRMVLVGSRVSVGIAGRSQYAASSAALEAVA